MEELPLICIKENIVYTLENLPNKSCKADNLIKEVIKHLKIKRLGKKREEFAQVLKKGSADLKRANIIESYKTKKNTRVRLTKEYENKFKNLKKRWDNQNSSIIKQSDDNKQILLFNESHTFDNDIFTTKKGLISSIPDLPEALVNYDEQYSHEGDEYEHDEETLKLLYTITNEKENVEDNIDDEPITNPKSFEPDNIDIIGYLMDRISTIPNVKADRFLDTIKILCEYKQLSVKASIEFKNHGDKIVYISYFPFKVKAAFDLLELSGKMDFESNIGITHIKYEKKYIVKNTQLIKHMNIEEILILIKKSILETFKINKILVEYS